VTLAGLLIAADGTTTFAGALTLVLPIGLVIVMLATWWVALRRGRTPRTDGATKTEVGSEESPPVPPGP